MRFKTFLTEAPWGPGRKKLNGVDEALDFLTKNCDDYLNACANVNRLTIFRGEVSSNAAYEVTDSTQFVRKSANTQSWYNMWIDNSPTWQRKNYPRRLRSFICSSRFSDDYGSAKIVFPTNGCKIGLCPREDIWISFTTTFGGVFGSSRLSSIDQFQDVIYQAWKYVNVHNTLPDIKRFNFGDDLAYAKIEAMRSYADLKMKLQSCTLDKIVTEIKDNTGVNLIKNKALDFVALEDLTQNYHINDYQYKPFLVVVEAMIKNNIKNLAQLFDAVLDPDKNNFMSLTPKTADEIVHNREVWVEGRCLFIEPDLIYASEDKKKLADFFSSVDRNFINYFT